MDCEETVAKYAEYEQGILNDTEREQVESHLGECADCRSHATSMERLNEILGKMPSSHPPEGIWQGIADQIQGTARRRSFITKATSPAGRSLRTVLTRPAFSIVMALLILAFGLWFGYLNYLDYQYPVMVEMPDQNPGGFAAVHAGMSAQEPLAQKSAWALAVALATTSPSPTGVPAPVGGGGHR